MTARNDIGAVRLVGPGAGGGTIRIGDTVRRTPDRAPDAMILVLRHLEAVGFGGAPRVIGQDCEGRWALSYIPGDTALPPYPAWVCSDALLTSVGRLLRSYHDATETLAEPPEIDWPTRPPAHYRGDVVGHMDVSLANVVCAEGQAIALIDFEEVGRVARVWDLARTARHWVPLLDPADMVGNVAYLRNRQHERLSIFADAYGIDQEDRDRLVEAAIANADTTYSKMRNGAAAGHAGYTAEWTGLPALRNRRSRAWMLAHRSRLRGALGVDANASPPDPILFEE